MTMFEAAPPSSEDESSHSTPYLVAQLAKPWNVGQNRTLTRDSAEAGRWKTRTSFIYTKTPGDVLERFSGWASHEPVAVEGAVKIKPKRIDFIDLETLFSTIQLFMRVTRHERNGLLAVPGDKPRS